MTKVTSHNIAGRAPNKGKDKKLPRQAQNIRTVWLFIREYPQKNPNHAKTCKVFPIKKAYPVCKKNRHTTGNRASTPSSPFNWEKALLYRNNKYNPTADNACKKAPTPIQR